MKFVVNSEIPLSNMAIITISKDDVLVDTGNGMQLSYKRNIKR